MRGMTRHGLQTLRCRCADRCGGAVAAAAHRTRAPGRHQAQFEDRLEDGGAGRTDQARRRRRAGAGLSRMKATADAVEIAEAVKGGQVTARAVTEAALKRIERHNPMLGAFTDVTAARALEQ